MADRYLRKAAAAGGNGQSWTTAWNEFSAVTVSQLASGTLWIATGNYTTAMPDMTNIDNVTIKRAVDGSASTRGPAADWNAAYDGQVNVDSPNGWFTGTGCDNLIIDGATHNPWGMRIIGVTGDSGMIFWINATGGTFRNLDMDGNDEHGYNIEDGFRFSESVNVLVEHCYIRNYHHDPDGANGHNDGIQDFEGNGFIYRYNISRNCGQHLILGETAFGNNPLNNVQIYYNVFENDPSDADSTYDTLATKGSGGTNWKIENNTFVVRNSVISQNHGTIYHYSGEPVSGYYVRNNIFYDSPPGDVTTATRGNNCYYLSGTAPSETGRVTADPLFTNYAGYDYRLQAGSPCATSGLNLGYTQDILGNPVGSSNISMGAYQFGTGSSPPTGTITLSVR